MSIIVELLGVPASEREQFTTWSDAFVADPSVTADTVASIERQRAA